MTTRSRPSARRSWPTSRCGFERSATTFPRRSKRRFCDASRRSRRAAFKTWASLPRRSFLLAKRREQAAHRSRKSRRVPDCARCAPWKRRSTAMPAPTLRRPRLRGARAAWSGQRRSSWQRPGSCFTKPRKKSGARPAPSPAAPPGASAEQRDDTPLAGPVPSGSGTSSGADHVAAGGTTSATPGTPAAIASGAARAPASVPAKGAPKSRSAVNAPAAGSAATLVAPATAPAAPATRSEEDLLMNRH